LASALAALRAGQTDEASKRLDAAARQHPILDDLVLYLRARVAMRAGRGAKAVEAASQLAERHPDSVWLGRAALVAGRVCRRTGDTANARSWLATARSALPPASDRWVRATVLLAELEADGDPRTALDLAHAVRTAAPRRLAARRARRLADRIREAHPDLAADPEGHVDEAELRLREGDATGAMSEARTALGSGLSAPLMARARWVVAQGEHTLGNREAAEQACLELANDATSPLAAKALTGAATWRWNADDDARALALFDQVVHRFPEAPQATEALYAIGRIQQEAGRLDTAATAYATLADRYPQASQAREARWRAAWVRYLAGEYDAAAKAFGHAARGGKELRVSAEYWRARALERAGSPDAGERLEHVADRHPRSYYGMIAEERLGRAAPVAPASLEPTPVGFPADVEGAHADRARALLALGLTRLAQPEVDALRGTASERQLVEAYAAVDAPWAAIRVAASLGRESRAGVRRYLYPLGFWDLLRPQAEARGLDPFFVASVIRQESLFDPDAASPADAHGLMQLLPRTARELSTDLGRPPPDRTGLRDPATSIQLGTLLLRRLLDRYDGSRVKALAAYNAGEDAVAKWERRYPDRPEDEFVELISFRETRDYVKAVLRHYQTYRIVYAPAPSPAVTSDGSPPNAPFDMMTMTSPGRADSTR
jgi:soluble lytic murein transglycosylase